MRAGYNIDHVFHYPRYSTITRVNLCCNISASSLWSLLLRVFLRVSCYKYRYMYKTGFLQITSQLQSSNKLRIYFLLFIFTGRLNVFLKIPFQSCINFKLCLNEFNKVFMHAGTNYILRQDFFNLVS